MKYINTAHTPLLLQLFTPYQQLIFTNLSFLLQAPSISYFFLNRTRILYCGKMLYIQKFGVFGLLSFAIGVLAAPTNTTDGDLTLDDIINTPIVAAPLNPAYQPIIAVSNQTAVDTNPNI